MYRNAAMYWAKEFGIKIDEKVFEEEEKKKE